ncbi:MAG: hypothetical protein CBE00_02145 [Planctomycetaceae bacterium TMED240]|nr:MAG: hypothetical protein CBE00_02145 [Planctomycetaceae bacterium TMED240]
MRFLFWLLCDVQNATDYDHQQTNEKGTGLLTGRLTLKRTLFAAFGLLVLMQITTLNAMAEDAKDDFAVFSLPLFDGNSLLGWEGNAYWFRVEDKAIVAGRLTEKIPHNEFLCTAREYSDFDLRFEAKLVGDGKNAGVQFRSQRVVGSSEVSGYQADIGYAWNRPVWGALYDESRRNKMLAEPGADLGKKLVKPDQWNFMRVVCKGPRVQIFVNGERTVDYTEMDDAIPQHGKIGLQIHSGKPTEAWYRNIRIRAL